jgi:CRISPR system Cascade subunit CasB
MSALIESLESRNKSDSKVRAILRRSLSFTPGAFVPAYPYVEPFVKNTGDPWRREAHYLAAGLWASHWREGRTGQSLTIGNACAAHQSATGSTSTERRFINLLDADTDQLPHRLRQMIALLKDLPVDFEALLKGLLWWNDDEKRTQNAWAREFYGSIDAETEAEPVPQEEVTS